MQRKLNYWIGARPSNSKRWQNADSGSKLELAEYEGALFGLYRRYAKQWNDIELDHTRNLSEHTHSVCGAKVVGSFDKFILEFSVDRDNGWILELAFSFKFKKYYPGMSTALNMLRTHKDVKNAILHWRGNGQNLFYEWLAIERLENEEKGEWTEYKE